MTKRETFISVGGMNENQYIGDTTPLDKMFSKCDDNNVSANPMDTCWAGPQYTEEYVKKIKGD